MAAIPDAAERACQKLSRRLARLVTVDGYRALLWRSLQVARREFPSLAGISAGSQSEACLAGLASVDDVDTANLHAALTEVLAGVVGLLTTFIGNELAIQVVRDVWPEAPYASGSAMLVQEANS